jgi:hypothetical protein
MSVEAKNEETEVFLSLHQQMKLAPRWMQTDEIRILVLTITVKREEDGRKMGGPGLVRFSLCQFRWVNQH